MKQPTTFQKCLAVGMHFAEHSSALSEERHFAKPSRWKRWLPVWLVPLLGLVARSWDWARFLAP